MSFPRARRGFTLLEILLVLVLLVGILAIVWPAVGRSLASNDLRQGARSLRDALAEARRLATDSGEPVLVRIEPDGRTIRFDRWHRAVETPDSTTATTSDSSADGDPAAGNEPRDESRGSVNRDSTNRRPESTSAVAPFERPSGPNGSQDSRSVLPAPLPSHRLADEIVIVSIRSTADSGAASTLGSSFGSSFDSPTSAMPLGMSRVRGASDLPPLGSSKQFGNEGEFDSTAQSMPSSGWIWFLPHGQAPGTEIRLFDARRRRELTVTIDGWTGAIDIGPDRRVPDEQLGTTSTAEQGTEFDSPAGARGVTR